MKKISLNTISRVILYIRTLEELIQNGVNTVSSAELASLMRLTDVQIRKDISGFGKIGTPRIGYNTTELKNILEEYIFQKKSLKLILFGVGNLGMAILKYQGFHKQRLQIVAAVDKNNDLIGKQIGDVTILSFEQASEYIHNSDVDIGIIAVPKDHAQEVADLMVLSGLKKIINFSPKIVKVPQSVSIKEIDLSIEFLSLYCEGQI